MLPSRQDSSAQRGNMQPQTRQQLPQSMSTAVEAALVPNVIVNPAILVRGPMLEVPGYEPIEHPFSALLNKEPNSGRFIQHQADYHPPQPVEPRVALQDTDKAEYYRTAINAEIMSQQNMIPWFLALDPRIQPKTVENIMKEAYNRWTERMRLLRVQKKPMQEINKAKMDDNTATNSLANPWHSKELFEIFADSIGRYDTGADEASKTAWKVTVGKETLKELKKWTEEWDLERQTMELQYKRHSPKGPPTQDSDEPPFRTLGS